MVVDKIAVKREGSLNSICGNKIKREVHTGERKNNSLWLRTLKESKSRTVNNFRGMNKKGSGRISEDLERIRRDTKVDDFEPVFHGMRIIQPPDGKDLIHLAKNLVREVYSGLNASGNRELVLSMQPSLFRDTHIRIEKTGRARLRIIIDSKDASALNFFNKFYDSIRAGLLKRGLVLDEFKVNR